MPRATGEISTLKLGPFIREPTSSALHVYSRLPHGSTAHIQQKGISTQWRERAAAPHSTIIARKWCRHSGHFLWARVDGNRCVWPSKALTFM